MTKKVNIDIVARDKTKRAIDQSKKGLGSLKTAALAVSAALATIGAGRAISGLIQVGKEVESLRVRFKFLFGSVSEGNKAFDALANFAARVPFSLQEISLASGNHAVVAKEADQLADSLTQVMTRMVTIQEEIIEALKTAKEAQTIDIEMDGGEFKSK